MAIKRRKPEEIVAKLRQVSTSARSRLPNCNEMHSLQLGISRRRIFATSGEAAVAHRVWRISAGIAFPRP